MTGSAVTARTRFSSRASSRTERDQLQKASESITDRDHEICLSIFEHGILTTRQIYQLYFDSESRARRRLAQLWKLEILVRRRPRKRPGSHPWHYRLDRLGMLIVAELQGVEPKDITYRIDTTLGLVESQRLKHTRERNSFFTALAYACRFTEGYTFDSWIGEEACKAHWKYVKPDGFARIQTPREPVSILVELDLGTETLGELAAKLDRYRLISRFEQVPDALLFCFNSDKRERSARRALGGCGIPIATSTIERHQADPLGRTWLPLDADHRVPLEGLPHLEEDAPW